ncbi:bifunctional transcriptional activator/DNA repair enzyme AdaA [Hymenobacter sediminicola]|uniref:methylated-DNA--[protein]-cysteine S-methyltransferase n=1 Tax=Hymenobacter sediminicola TaxID=2761579 RepID=A0A7G7WAU3_9BACT|nr:methylated-DNA--[protein]-cysteine S-methyltransferase [Hymenobacter sediminicola]QNH63486.1 methylated-DNA--[protein]-cysteine S-methyltransferase [Hymenobacter sediminicola]
MSQSQAELDYARVEQAIEYIAAHFMEQPALEDIASHVHLSPFHFNRLFTRWAGTSPQRFLRFLTKEYARQILADSGSVLDAAYQAGLSGAGRLHDLFVTYEAMTPAEYRGQAAGLVIRYGFHPTRFGECLLSLTDRGICGLTFQPAADWEAALNQLRAAWPGATLQSDSAETGSVAAQLFAAEQVRNKPLPLLLKGTNFQIKVWEALLRIPAGALVSYRDVAAAIGQPGASQAVGGAVGANHIGYLIPCHRVIQQHGGPGGYRWGSARKQALLGWEATRTEHMQSVDTCSQ